jgi:hypothetical protein
MGNRGLLWVLVKQLSKCFFEDLFLRVKLRTSYIYIGGAWIDYEFVHWIRGVIGGFAVASEWQAAA